MFLSVVYWIVPRPKIRQEDLEAALELRRSEETKLKGELRVVKAGIYALERMLRIRKKAEELSSEKP